MTGFSARPSWPPAPNYGGSEVQQTVTTIVLAGGLSTRMGRDKALLELDGMPLLTRICHLGLAVGNQVYVVAGRDYGEVLPVGCDRIDDRALEGPLYAFSEALDQIDRCAHDWILLLSCDLPYLDQTTVEQWIQQLETVPQEAIAYLAKNPQGFSEVLCGFYRGSCRQSLALAIQTGERSFQRWLRSEVVTELVWADRRVFFNCNKPEDWEITEQIAAERIALATEVAATQTKSTVVD
jgi:molybdenum cofactor guanylyltransferase